MFFLEGSETFSFSSSVSFTPFFSRNIGLVNGKQIPVLFGTKLYGKIGDTNLSLLDVQTGAAGDLSGRNTLAARMTHNIFAESKVGWIFTNGSARRGRQPRSGRGAFRLRHPRRFSADKTLRRPPGRHNWNEEKTGRRHGFGFRGNYPNDLWNIQSTYAWYGDALNPAWGSSPATASRPATSAWVFSRVRARDSWAGSSVQFYFNASADYYWDLSGNLETRTLMLSPLRLSVRTR